MDNVNIAVQADPNELCEFGNDLFKRISALHSLEIFHGSPDNAIISLPPQQCTPSPPSLFAPFCVCKKDEDTLNIASTPINYQGNSYTFMRADHYPSISIFLLITKAPLPNGEHLGMIVAVEISNVVLVLTCAKDALRDVNNTLLQEMLLD